MVLCVQIQEQIKACRSECNSEFCKKKCHNVIKKLREAEEGVPAKSKDEEPEQEGGARARKASLTGEEEEGEPARSKDEEPEQEGGALSLIPI